MARGARVRTATDRQIMRKIGRQIRKERTQRDMTQGELAGLLGFTRPTSITMVEQGVVPVTPMDLGIYVKADDYGGATAWIS